MTTAKIESRTYVPYDTFAVKFCDVKFYGDNVEELSHEWHKVKFGEEYHKYQPLFHEQETKVKDLQNKLDEENNRLPWYRFGSKIISFLEIDLEEAKALRDEYSEKIQDASTVLYKTEEWLESKGFLPKQHSEGSYNIDIWERQ